MAYMNIEIEDKEIEVINNILIDLIGINSDSELKDSDVFKRIRSVLNSDVVKDIVFRHQFKVGSKSPNNDKRSLVFKLKNNVYEIIVDYSNLRGDAIDIRIQKQFDKMSNLVIDSSNRQELISLFTRLIRSRNIDELYN